MLDSTHVCYFSLATCEYIAAHWNAALELPGSEVFLFQKKNVRGMSGQLEK